MQPSGKRFVFFRQINYVLVGMYHGCRGEQEYSGPVTSFRSQDRVGPRLKPLSQPKSLRSGHGQQPSTDAPGVCQKIRRAQGFSIANAVREGTGPKGNPLLSELSSPETVWGPCACLRPPNINQQLRTRSEWRRRLHKPTAVVWPGTACSDR